MPLPRGREKKANANAKAKAKATKKPTSSFPQHTAGLRKVLRATINDMFEHLDLETLGYHLETLGYLLETLGYPTALLIKRGFHEVFARFSRGCREAFASKIFS